MSTLDMIPTPPLVRYRHTIKALQKKNIVRRHVAPVVEALVAIVPQRVRLADIARIGVPNRYKIPTFERLEIHKGERMIGNRLTDGLPHVDDPEARLARLDSGRFSLWQVPKCAGKCPVERLINVNLADLAIRSFDLGRLSQTMIKHNYFGTPRYSLPKEIFDPGQVLVAYVVG